MTTKTEGLSYWKTIEKVLVLLGSFCLFAIVMLICFEVFCRYTELLWFDWLEELVRYFGIASVMFLAGPVTNWGAHLKIDILVRLLDRRKWRMQEIVANILTCLFCGFVAWQGWLMTLKYYQMHVRGPSGDFLLWPVDFFFFLGFSLAAIAFAARAANLLLHREQSQDAH